LECNQVSEPQAASPEAFDKIFLAYERSACLPALMRSVLDETLPAEVEPFSFVTVAALEEIATTLRLAAGELLVDLACGRGGPGMWVARCTGARLVGVDFSAVALTQARLRVGAFQLTGGAEFRVGELDATGLVDAGADGLMCVDSVQFASDAGRAAREAWRVLRPGRRLVFTSWEPREGAHRHVPEVFARLDFDGLLRAAGFTEVRVAEREAWHQRQHAVYQQALAADPGDDPALERMRSEATRMLPLMPLLRRVIITAVRPH
jgi:ubiquinone/menaquinone biosynthesis C-methylase UbiE